MNRRYAMPLWLLGLPLFMAWPLPIVWRSAMLTNREGEAIIHTWGLWSAASGGHPFLFHPGALAWPDGFKDVLVDPANLPWFLLGWPFGPEAAYNTVIYGGLVLMGVAGALLARCAGGAPWLGALVGASCASALAATSQGITEQLGVAWVGIATALLITAIRDGGTKRCALAALTLALSWYSGPYNGVFASLIALVIGVAALARGPDRKTVFTRLAGTAIGAVALVGPMAHAVLSLRVDGQPGTALMAGATLSMPAGNTSLYRGGLKHGADLVDPFLPVWMTGAAGLPNHTAYLGAAALLLAIAAVVMNRRLWPWLAGAMGFTLLSLGPYLYMRGVPVTGSDGSAMMGPTGWIISAIPFFGRMSHWYRAAGVATLLLAVPISTLGRAHLHRAVPVLAALLLVADRLWGSPMSWPLPSSTLPKTAAYSVMQGEGAVLTLPASIPDTVPPRQWRNPILLGQLFHQRPVSEPGKWGHTVSKSGAHAINLVNELASKGSVERGHRKHFAQAGFGWAVIYTPYLRGPSKSLGNSAHLKRCLGTPLADDGYVRIYALPQIIPESCLRGPL